MYHYKVTEGSALHTHISEFMERVKKVKDAARALAKELSDNDEFYSDPHTVAGGIGALIFRSKPDGYKQVGERWQSAYYPKASNKEICNRINVLPTIDCDEMNALIGFKPGTSSESVKGGGISYYNTFGLKWGKGATFLVDIPMGMDFTPIDGMIEITTSEYASLVDDKIDS